VRLKRALPGCSCSRNQSRSWAKESSEAGNRLGEEYALRVLAESKITLPMKFTEFRLTRFDGKQVAV
jgi:hypothetical protein